MDPYKIECYSSFILIIVQSTWFTALLAIDEYRVNKRLDGCLCCILHTDSSADQARLSVWSRVFRSLSQLLVTTPVKIMVSVVTVSCLAGGVLGTLNLTMEFKPEWLMDPNSEVKKYLILIG